VQPYDKNKKVQYLNVNGVNQGEISFPFTLKWREISAGIVSLMQVSTILNLKATGLYLF